MITVEKLSHLISPLAIPMPSEATAAHQYDHLEFLAAETVPIGVLILDGPEYMINFINPVILRLWGRTKEQTLHKPLYEALPELAGQGFEALLKDVFTTGVPYFGNEVPAVLNINGQPTTVYVNFVYSPIRNTKGVIESISVIATNVTSQVQTRQQLQLERERLRSLFVQAPAFIALLKGPDLIFELANEAYYQLVGHREILGKAVFEAIPEARDQGFKELLDTVYQTGEPFVGQEMLIHLQRTFAGPREERYVNFVYQPTHDAVGEVDGVFCHGVDVTDQVRARQQIETAERRFRALIEKTNEGIALVSQVGKIHYVSPSIKHILGFSEEEFLALENVSQLIHPDDLATVEQHFLRILQTPGETSRLSYRHRHKLGHDVWLDVVVSNLLHEPAVEAIVINYRDISQQKRAEDTLQQQSRQAQLTADIGLALISDQPIGGRLQQCAESITQQVPATLVRIWSLHEADQMLELQASAGLYTNLDDIYNRIPVGHLEIGHVAQERVPRFADNVAKGNYVPDKAWVKEHGIVGYAGYPLIVGERLVGVMAIFAQQPFSAAVREVLGAIANQMALGMERDRVSQEHETLARQKDEFLAVATHELKTPVTSIKAYTQGLEHRFRKQGDTASAQLLGKMDAQLDKLQALIADLLDVTKIEGGKLQFHLDQYDFATLVEETVEEMQRTTTKHQIVHERLSTAEVCGDRDRTGQVLVNFLSNAIKYSPHTDRIIVRTEADAEAVSVSVQDFGVGIPDQKQSRVFERFYRVSGPREDTFPGLGLGLYISAEIIRRQGGRIWVTSQQGHGSTFYFSLPRQAHLLVHQHNDLVISELAHE